MSAVSDSLRAGSGDLPGPQKGSNSSDSLVAPPALQPVAPTLLIGNINATYRIHPKMFNQQRYLKNKSIKKVSPKTRRTAELYKSSHNIGNRTAAERVGSYKETEVALVYPEGFWEAVKIDDGSGSPSEGQSRSRSRSPKSSPRSPSNDLSPTRTHRRTAYSPCSLLIKKSRHSDSTSIESSESSGEDSETSMKDTKVAINKRSDSKPSSKTRRGGAGSSRECSEERNHATANKKGPKTTKATTPKASGKANSAGHNQSGKKSQVFKDEVWGRAPRIKRTACLNAAAIVGLLYENEEPAHKKRKVEVQVEVDTEASMDSEDAYDTYYDVQFDRDLKRALAASLEDTTHKHKKGSAAGAISAGKDKDCTNSKASCDSSSKKCSAHKEKESKCKKSKEKEKEKDKAKDTKKDNKESGKDKKAKKPGKEKDKQIKAKKESTTAKKVVSKKVKTPPPPKEAQKKVSGKVSKKEVNKEEETSEESESEESADEQKPEEDIPLWPPPKRMASLNATAILAASKDPRKPTPERAARIVIYVKNRKDVLPRRPKSQSYRGSRVETGRWVPGLATAEIESSLNYDPYAFQDSPVEVAEVEEERESPSPDIQVLSVESGSPRPAPPLSPPRDLQPAPSPSPDVQIIEVRSQPPPVARSPQRADQRRYAPTGPSPTPNSRQAPPAHHGGVPVPAHQVARKSLHSPPHHGPSRVAGSQMQAYPPPHPSQLPSHRPGHHSPHLHPSQHPHHRADTQRIQPLPAHHSQPPGHLSATPYYHHHHQGKGYTGPTKPFVSVPRHGSPPHHAAHHNMPAQPLPPLSQPQAQVQPQSPQHPQQPQAGYHHPSALTQGGSGGGGTPPQGPPPPAHQPHPQPPPHRPPSIKGAYDDTGSIMTVDRMPTPTQTPPVAQGGYQTSTHGYVHQSGPMGNTCTYPYPHSGGGGGGGGGGNGGGGGGSGAAGAAGPAGGPQSTHCQGFPFGSMGSVSSYHMMAACHSRPFSSAFSVPSFNHSFGYYPADGLMDAFGETTTCCVPLSYHIHQQQVKVLVHNTAIPPYPTGPNPYHHPKPSPTVTLIPDPPPAVEVTASCDSKPPGSGNVVLVDTSGQEVASSPGEISPGGGSMTSAHRKYLTGQEPEPETGGRTYKPERLDEDERRGVGDGGCGDDGGVTYKMEARLTPPTCPASPPRHQDTPPVAHKEEKIDVTDDAEMPPEKPYPATITIADVPLLPHPPRPSPPAVTSAPEMAPIALPPEVLTAKVEKRSPDTVSREAAEAPLPAPEQCKVERCPSPVDAPIPFAAPSPTLQPVPSAEPLPLPLVNSVHANPAADDQGGPSRPAEKACTPGTEEQQEPEELLLVVVEEEEGTSLQEVEEAEPGAKGTTSSEANTEPPSQDDETETVPTEPPRHQETVVLSGRTNPTWEPGTDRADKPGVGEAAAVIVSQESGQGSYDKENPICIDVYDTSAASVSITEQQKHSSAVHHVASPSQERAEDDGKDCVQGDIIIREAETNSGSVVCVVGDSVHEECGDVILNANLNGVNGERQLTDECGEVVSTTSGLGCKRVKTSCKLKNGDIPKSNKTACGKGSTTAKIVNSTFKAAKGSSKSDKSSGGKPKSKRTKKKVAKGDTQKQLSKLKKSKLPKSKTAKKLKADKKSKLKNDKLKSKVKKLKIKIKIGAFGKAKILKAGASAVVKKTGRRKSSKKDPNNDSSWKCTKKLEAISSPKVKLELCNTSKIKIKNEREDSISPKLVPSLRQLRIDTSSPKLTTAAATTEQGSSLSPKQKRESSTSPKLRPETSVSPKLRRDSSVNPRLRRESSLSPKLRQESLVSLRLRQESSVSPKLRCESSVTPKLRRECSVSPKLRRECSVSPKLRRECSVSPKLRRECSVSLKLRSECSISPKLRQASSISPKLRRESSVSPKIRRENSGSPKLRYECSVSPKSRRELSSPPKQSKREETSSPKSQIDSHSNTSSPRSSCSNSNSSTTLRREDLTASPKIRYRDQLPTNKVLRVQVEPLNPKTGIGPKPAARDTCSPNNKGDTSVSPRQEAVVSPASSSSSRTRTKEDDRRVMLGPRKMVPVKRAQAAYSGWHWEGAPYYSYCQVQPQDSPPVRRKYYKAIRHEDGDVIQVRDCVLVRSGPRKKDIPYVAKIGDFWEAPKSGDMMMSIMWYYRPEQAESDRLPRHVTAELFASKHKDEASIACIDDKCFVLTFNEFCRYKSHQKQIEQGFKLHTKLVPALARSPDEPPPKRQRIPRLNADPETVFVCRRVYDFKLKRILKNPTAN